MENRKFVFNVGCGNAWLTYSSIRPIAITTTIEKAVELIIKHAKENEIKLSDYGLDCLMMTAQTQGKETNYIIEMILLDTLL